VCFLACRRIGCQGFLSAKNFSGPKIYAIKMPSDTLAEYFRQILRDGLFLIHAGSGHADYQAEVQKAISQPLSEFFLRGRSCGGKRSEKGGGFPKKKNCGNNPLDFKKVIV
jgi:hypothetical protein